MPQTPLSANSALIFSPILSLSLQNNGLTDVEFQIRPGRETFNDVTEETVCSTVFNTQVLKVRQVYINPDAVIQGYTFNSIIGLGLTCQKVLPSLDDPNNIEEIDNTSII